VHRSTGAVADSRSERSQHRNWQTALRLLRAKLHRLANQRGEPREDRRFDKRGDVIWAYQARNYVLQPYTLVKDARTGEQTTQTHEVLDGEIACGPTRSDRRLTKIVVTGSAPVFSSTRDGFGMPKGQVGLYRTRMDISW
jgi:protein subunit release factor B